MTLKYSADLEGASLERIAAAIGNHGLMQIYDGARPVSPDISISSQTKIAELICGSPFGVFVAGGPQRAERLIGNDLEPSNAIASGAPSWFRISSADGIGKLDGTVGWPGAELLTEVTADLILDKRTVERGERIAVSLLTIIRGKKEP